MQYIWLPTRRPWHIYIKWLAMLACNLPISSRITNDFDVALLSMWATSVISKWKVDMCLTTLSLAPTRANKLSVTPKCAESAGTKLPICVAETERIQLMYCGRDRADTTYVLWERQSGDNLRIVKSTLHTLKYSNLSKVNTIRLMVASLCKITK